MMEIFVLPYLAISAAIGYAVFQPFLRFDEFESLSCEKPSTGDLLAIMFPISVLFAVAKSVAPDRVLSPTTQLVVVLTAFFFAAVSLAAGLFLLPKEGRTSAVKRMAIIGVVVPFGLLLAIGWIGPLIWAAVYSTLYLVPGTVGILAATVLLRLLASWACHNTPTRANEAADPLP